MGKTKILFILARLHCHLSIGKCRGKERKMLDDTGFPVAVIRHHMSAIERHIYRRRAYEACALATKEHHLLYYDNIKADKEEAKANLIEKFDREVPPVVCDLTTAIHVQDSFVETTANHSFDSWLQLERLSEGPQVLRRASFRIDNGEIAASNNRIKISSHCLLPSKHSTLKCLAVGPLQVLSLRSLRTVIAELPKDFFINLAISPHGDTTSDRRIRGGETEGRRSVSGCQFPGTTGKVA